MKTRVLLLLVVVVLLVIHASEGSPGKRGRTRAETTKSEKTKSEKSEKSKSKDPCDPDPCLNDGVCEVVHSSKSKSKKSKSSSRGPGYMCTCTPDFTGTNCETPIDFCANNPNPCQNGGTCVNDGLGGYTCDCNKFHEGDNCETEAPCPCVNGGVCVGSGADRQCECSIPWGGECCEIFVAYCEFNPPPCQNGGTCVNDGLGGYTCECNKFHEGVNCETEAPCPCVNGGVCVGSGANRQCQCSIPWGGECCDIFVAYCEFNPPPCQNGGTCNNDGLGGYTCDCNKFHEGVNCETEVPCPCVNGGVCVGSGANRQCECSIPWGGECCEIFVAYCEFNPPPCQNGGTCNNDGLGGYTCECNKFHEGENCETEVPCPCVNGGVCVGSGANRQCDCSIPWGGECCEIFVAYCEFNPPPCQNGGTCNNDGLGGYTCECAEFYSGFNCEIGP